MLFGKWSKLSWILALVIVLGALPVMAGEGGDKTVRIWYLTWLWSDEIQEMASRFAEETGIDVKVEWIDGGNINERLTLAVTAGVPPDVVQVTTARTLGAKDLLVPLAEYIDRTEEMNWDDFFGAPKEWSYDQVTGNIYGIPFTTDCRVLAWNKRQFREVGLPEDQAPAYFDELLAYSRRLTQFNDDGSLKRVGFEFGGEGRHFAQWLGAAGGEMWDLSVIPPVAMPQLDRAIAAYRFGADVMEVLGGWQTYQGYQGTDLWERFNGTTAMLVVGSPAGKQIRNLYDIEMGVAPIPIEREHGRPYSLAGGYQYAIPVGAENPELGWKFIEWFVEAENLAGYTEATGWIPPRYSALDYFQPPEWMDETILSIAPNGRAWPETMGASYHYQVAFEEVLRGETPPEAAAMKAREAMQAAADARYAEHK